MSWKKHHSRTPYNIAFSLLFSNECIYSRAKGAWLTQRPVMQNMLNVAELSFIHLRCPACEWVMNPTSIQADGLLPLPLPPTKTKLTLLMVSALYSKYSIHSDTQSLPRMITGGTHQDSLKKAFRAAQEVDEGWVWQKNSKVSLSINFAHHHRLSSHYPMLLPMLIRCIIIILSAYTFIYFTGFCH